MMSNRKDEALIIYICYFTRKDLVKEKYIYEYNHKKN